MKTLGSFKFFLKKKKILVILKHIRAQMEKTTDGLNCVTGVAWQPCLFPLSLLGTAHHLNVDDLWWHIWGPACTSVPHHYRLLPLLILVPLLNTSTDFQWRASVSQFYAHSLRWDILGEHISHCYCSSLLLLCKYDGTFGNLCYLYFINELVFFSSLYEMDQ